MYNKNQIRQKALTLAVTSVLGTGYILKSDSVQAMKKLKAIGHSIKKTVTQEDKKQRQRQQQLENEIAILMYNKLHRNDLTKEQETKLVDNLEIIKVSGEKVKIFDLNDKTIKTINPLAEIVSPINFEEGKFVSLLEWLNLHIPEAFNVDNVTSQLFRAIKIGSNNGTCKNERKQKATAMCKHLLVYNPDLTQKRKFEFEKSGACQLTALEFAQKIGLPEVVEIILDKSGNKQYLLYNAICSGNLEAVKKAISEGANVNELVYGSDFKGFFDPVILALAKKNITMADFLIQNGAKIPELDIALTARHAGIFDYLIQNGAKLSPNASPIELIFETFDIEYKFWKDQKNIKFLEKIIQDGRINITWKEGYHKFFPYIAEVYENKVIRDFYFAQGEKTLKHALADVCGSNKTPESKKIELAELILNRNCEIDEWPVWSACSLQEYTLAKLLINNGAPIKYISMTGRSPLMLIIRHISGNADVNFAKYLVNDCKVSLNGIHYLGLGLIYSFKDYFFEKVEQDVAEAILEMATFLIEKGMNVNAIDKDGNTFLSSCINERDEEGKKFSDIGRALFDLFVEAGAKRYLD